ncbi:uncharacterized protein LOC126745778 [Anthonomus grandis grandis]|uniref:uncharacterized protein LOC126745778 n=1 Tax=Anthonomus grandis grandis TaxID=2921223 RepID=UPI0021651C08|nr:uncharacterized protein LOC126745778 [Anthonomus grandis grandis]
MEGVVYGRNHIRTHLGILKLLEILFCLLGALLVGIEANWKSVITTVNAFYAATVLGLIISAIILSLSCSSTLGLYCNKLLRRQFYILFFLFIFNLNVSSLLIDKFPDNKVIVAGGVIGLLAAIIYLIDAILSYKTYGVTHLC